MDLEVQDSNGTETLIENVNRYMADADNRLFVIGDNNKQLAVYASGAWHSAVNVTPDDEDDDEDAEADIAPHPGPYAGRI